MNVKKKLYLQPCMRQKELVYDRI